MGNSQNKDKLHCNRFLDKQGPPSLEQQIKQGLNGTNTSKNSCQPDGEMVCVMLHRDLPGFPQNNAVQINFIFQDGIQTDKHPHPGQPYSRARIIAFLPDSREGKKVIRLLEQAFNKQLLFTIATDKDGKDCITTTSIPLKTTPDAGNGVDGYPDPDYLKIVTKLLKDKVGK